MKYTNFAGIVILTIFIASLGAFSSATRAQAPQAALEHLKSLYPEIESVHLRASVEVSVRLPLYEGHRVPLLGYGTIEHWEKDQKFRTQTWVDPKLGLFRNLEIAYNGEHYQYHELDSGLLALEEPQFVSEDLMSVPAATPNPFYLPLSDLAPGDDECPGCQLTLNFLKDEARWDRKLAAMQISKNSGSMAHLPGGTRLGEMYSYQVRVGEMEGVAGGVQEPPRISRIDRIRSDGKLTASTVFSGFAELEVQGSGPGKKLLFPREIRMDGYDPDQTEGQHAVRVEYKIEMIELNVDLADEIFTIESDGQTVLWERGELVQARSANARQP
jgi:outer membrane lipoprotein-sorting protein